MRSFTIALAVTLTSAPAARAEIVAPSLHLEIVRTNRDVWLFEQSPCHEEQAALLPAARSLTFRSSVAEQGASPASADPATQSGDPSQQSGGQPLHAAAIEHSDAYRTRAKIHKYASYATLPLFATEVILGQSLYSGTGSSGSRTAHAFVGGAIVGLFAVNTVTGAWNLFGEGWQEKEGRTLRLAHGLLMMAADVGFVATTRSGPNSHGRRGALTFQTDEVTHRNMAIVSISVATTGYLLMLFGNH